MAKVKFTLGANTLEFSRGPVYPSTRPLERLQVVDRTAAGTLKTEDLGAVIRRFKIAFKGLSQTNYTGLENWFNLIGAGSTNEFTYHDENEDTYIVRMITNPLEFKQTYHGRYEGELELEVV